MTSIPVSAEPWPQTSAGGEVFDESGPDGGYSLRVVPGKQRVYLVAGKLKD